MEVICSLPELHSLLVGKNNYNETKDKLFIIADGMSFSKNQLRDFLKRVAKVPARILYLSLQMNSVEVTSTSLETDLRELLLLDFNTLTFELSAKRILPYQQDKQFNKKTDRVIVDHFNSDKYCVFLRFVNEVVDKFSNLKSFRIVLKKRFIISIEGQSVTILVSLKRHAFENNKLYELLGGIIQLLHGIKGRVKELKFKLELLNKTSICNHFVINKFYEKMGELSRLEKAQVLIDFGQQNEDIYTSFSSLFNLQSSSLKTVNFTCNLEQDNVHHLIESSKFLSDGTKIFQLNASKSRPLNSTPFIQINKIDKTMILDWGNTLFSTTSDSYLVQTKAIAETIKSWRMIQIEEFELLLHCLILEDVNILSSLSSFLEKQKRILKFKLNMHATFLPQQARYFNILTSLSASFSLLFVEIDLRGSRFQMKTNVNTELLAHHICTLPKSLETLLVCLPNLQKMSTPPQPLYPFMKIFSHFRKVNRMAVDEDGMEEWIHLIEEKCEIHLNSKKDVELDAIFQPFLEGNHIVERILNLNISLSGFDTVTRESIQRGLFLLSVAIQSIVVNINQTIKIPFEFDFQREMNLDRNFKLYIQNILQFSKEGNSQILLKLTTQDIDLLKTIYPDQQIVIEQELPADNVLQKQSEIGIQVEEDKQNKSGSIRKSKKRKCLNNDRTFIQDCPTRYQKLMLLIYSFSKFSHCTIDLSMVRNIDFLQYFSRCAPQFSGYFNLQIPINDLNDKHTHIFKKFFQRSTMNVTQLSVDCSGNTNLHNVGFIHLFYSLQSSRAHIQELSLDCSRCAMKTKAIKSLAIKLATMHQLRSIKLKISQSYNLNVLNLTAIESLLNAVNALNIPHLSCFSLSASDSLIPLNDTFFKILAHSLRSFSRQLRHLKLNFEGNYSKVKENSSIKPFLLALAALPSEMNDIHLNFKRTTTDFDFLVIPKYLVGFKLNRLTLKTSQYILADGDLEKHSNILKSALNHLRPQDYNKFILESLDLIISINNQKLTINNPKTFLIFLNQLPLHIRTEILLKITQFLISIKPNIKVDLSTLYQQFKILTDNLIE